MPVFISPYKMGSRGAKSLARSLLCPRITGQKVLPAETLLVNWGNSALPTIRAKGVHRILNKPEAVTRARDKRIALKIMRDAGVSVPDFTTDPAVADQWRRTGVVYGRALVSSQGGAGIQILTQESGAVPTLPLYTRGITKAFEFRLHLFCGSVIDYTQKKRRAGSDTDGMIKNLDNGWVFCRDAVALPQVVLDNAKAAVVALGLDFGAVDVLYKRNEDKAYVLEVNTAPGLEGTTLVKYSEAVRKLYESQNIGRSRRY